MRHLICSRGEPEERKFIPELTARGLNVELQGYGLKGVQSEAQWKKTYDLHRRFRDEYHGYLAVHGPFIGINYCHDDHFLRDAVMKRMDRTFDVVRNLQADILVVHSGFHSDVRHFDIYDEWVAATSDFWRHEILRYKAIGTKVVMENIVDDTPEFLVRVHDRVNDPSFKLCLDTGHVNVWAKTDLDCWINSLGSRIAHTHLHNNNGLTDQHLSLDQGTLDLHGKLDSIMNVNPEINLSFEILGSAGYLMEVIENLKLPVS